jgi:acetyltransferase
MKGFSNILILLTPQIMTDSLEISKIVAHISKKSDKNIFSSFIGDKEIKDSIDYFDSNNFSNFQTPSEAIQTMKILYDYNNFNYDNKVKPFKVTSEIDS